MSSLVFLTSVENVELVLHLVLLAPRPVPVVQQQGQDKRRQEGGGGGVVGGLEVQQEGV